MTAAGSAMSGTQLLLLLLLLAALLLATAASGEQSNGAALYATGNNPAERPNVPSLLYRACLDHLATRRRSLSAAASPHVTGRSVPVEVKPISLSQGLWIFGGSIAFSVVKVVGLSLLYYVAPEFVETWGPTFG